MPQGHEIGDTLMQVTTGGWLTQKDHYRLATDSTPPTSLSPAWLARTTPAEPGVRLPHIAAGRSPGTWVLPCSSTSLGNRGAGLAKVLLVPRRAIRPTRPAPPCP